ncbi:MAG: flagellar hook assembly protein FlgD [Methylophilaceae bacterium]|uniref:flagellar hook assembly protein FlgD n=1 Tax=Methylovorus sp. MM2 TaxID=1848038 RepID=UPI0007E1B19A|nr:flagellar hook assembly protein FlgD [Methylovorus sp. MM2]OAM51275.1 flagellar biosynthesis protein FlgD [Methylovorus sp. MM2]
MTTTTEVSSNLLSTMNGTTSSTKASSTEEIRNQFLTLLISQMKNQDPMNPMDNAEVTSQMAQLSTVTGINDLNDTVNTLMGNVSSSQYYQASSMIGHGVLVAGDSLSLSDGASYFGVNLPVGADKLTVTIKDSAGNEIKKMSVSGVEAGVLPLSWDGLTDSGTTAADGNYKFEVSATVGSSTVDASALSYQQVLSVSNTSSGVKLNLSNLTSVGTADVVEIF